KKRAAVTAAILAAAALTVTAGARIAGIGLTKDEHSGIIDKQYGESAAERLDEKGLKPDNEAICDHLKLTQELGACDGRNAQFILTIEAADDAGLEKIKNTPNYDFELVPVDCSEEDFLCSGWGRNKFMPDERYESFIFDIQTATDEPIRILVKAYELIVPESGHSERGDYLGEIEVELKRNMNEYEFIRDDGVSARLTDLSVEIDDEVDIAAETADGTTDSFTQEDWDNWNNEKILTLTMKDGTTQQYTRQQISGSGTIGGGVTHYFFGRALIDAENVAQFEFMGRVYKAK
ncbi:MAG: hypothetical protein IKR76_02540, partial [Ruminococcus sp.]|nr:hypothetical protein [Ruminococcus sp.]